MFADTRARDGAAGVVREDAGADDGGIADASPLLIHKATSRCGGSEIAGSVARHGPDGAELALVRLPAGLRREAKYPADEAAVARPLRLAASPDVVLVNDARKELIGKQRGAFKVHRISPKNEAWACRPGLLN